MVEAEQVAAPGDGGRFRLNSALSSLTSSSSARGAGDRRAEENRHTSIIQSKIYQLNNRDTRRYTMYYNKHILAHMRGVLDNKYCCSFVSEIQ